MQKKVTFNPNLQPKSILLYFFFSHSPHTYERKKIDIKEK